MRKLKQWLALALGAVMMFGAVACTDAGDSGSSGQGNSGQGLGQNGGKGRYVETEITPPGCDGEQLQSFLMNDGTLVCYTTDLTRRFESKDGGESWTETEGPAAADPQLGAVQNFDMMPDGTLMVALADPQTMMVTGLVKIAPDGSVQPFTVPQLEEAMASGKDVMLNQIKVLSDNRLYLSYVSGNFASGMVFSGGADGGDLPEGEDGGEGMSIPPAAAGDGEGDAPGEDEGEPEDSGSRSSFNFGGSEGFTGLVDLDSGEVVADLGDLYSMAMAVLDGVLYTLDYSGSILATSLEDGQSVKEKESSVPVDDMAFNLAMAAGPDGCLYVQSGSVVYKLQPGGTPEVLIEGSSRAFAMPGGFVSSMDALADGSVVMTVYGSGGSRVYRYAWDENAVLDPAKTLKVWSLYDNNLVRSAIRVLRGMYPDVEIEYEVAMGAGGNQTADDAIKTLNTRLLNGDGPDVMILDGCPTDSYIQKDMLLNLKDLVDTADMFENLLQPFAGQDGTYVLPMNFKLPLMLGAQENLDGLDSLEALVQRVAQGNGIPEYTPGEGMMAALPEEDRPLLSPSTLREIFDLLWSTGSGTVVGPNGLDSEAARSLLDALKQISDKYGLGEPVNEEDGTSAMVAMSTGDGAAATITGSVLAYAMQQAKVGAYPADDLLMLQSMSGAPDTQLKAFPGLTQGSWQPTSLAAVNADTEKADLAADFLQAMLGKEVQGVRTANGFSVTKTGMEAQIAAIDKMLRENQYGDGSGFDFDYETLVKQAQVPNTADETLTGMVWTVVQSLCQGNTDLEGAVKQLEQDLKNYLAERR